jgi:hypothetical protein
LLLNICYATNLIRSARHPRGAPLLLPHVAASPRAASVASVYTLPEEVFVFHRSLPLSLKLWRCAANTRGAGEADLVAVVDGEGDWHDDGAMRVGLDSGFSLTVASVVM